MKMRDFFSFLMENFRKYSIDVWEDKNHWKIEYESSHGECDSQGAQIA